MRKPRTQPRESATGKYGFEGDWGRKCICGHELGVHTGESPHECLNSDRFNAIGYTNQPAWFDRSITATSCDCRRFRPSRRKVSALPSTQSGGAAK